MTDVAALDFRFADDRIVGVPFKSTWSLLDYDVVIWNPANLLGQYYDETKDSRRFEGLPSLGEHESPRIMRDIARRRSEMEQLVQLGKTLIVLLPEPKAWYVETGEKQVSGTGRNSKTTRIVAESTIEEAFFFPVELAEAAGERIQLKGGEPFATFWRNHSDKFFYDTYLKEPIGTTTAVIQGTDCAVSSIADIEKGVVVLLPALKMEEALSPRDLFRVDPEERKEIEAEEEERVKEERDLLDGLFDLIDAIQVDTGDFALPEWTEQLLLPGERDLVDSLTKKEDRLAKLSTAIASDKAALSRLQERKLLFAGTGVPLEGVVKQAFEALGCDVEPGPSGEVDLVVRRNQRVAVVEVKGKSKSAAKSDASQLEGWISDFELEHGIQPKGILVVNAWRDRPLPDRREVEFPAQMLPYCERRDHCLITGLQMLGVMLEAEQKPRSKKKLFDAIFECVGVFGQFGDWDDFLARLVTEERKRSSDDQSSE